MLRTEHRQSDEHITAACRELPPWPKGLGRQGSPLLRISEAGFHSFAGRMFPPLSAVTVVEMPPRAGESPGTTVGAQRVRLLQGGCGLHDHVRCRNALTDDHIIIDGQSEVFADRLPLLFAGALVCASAYADPDKDESGKGRGHEKKEWKDEKRDKKDWEKHGKDDWKEEKHGKRDWKDDKQEHRYGSGRTYFHEHGYTRLNIPRGHYPPPGECRIWYPTVRRVTNLRLENAARLPSMRTRV